MPSRFIITVDDDPTVQTMIPSILSIESRSYARGEELLVPQALSEQPLAAFVDIQLGGKVSGLDLIPKLRKQWPSVPLIVITSDEKADTLKKALATGATDFIKKPIDPVDLKARFLLRVEESRKQSGANQVSFGDFTVRRDSGKVVGPKGSADASPKVLLLLLILAESGGTPLDREDLINRIWPGVHVTRNSLDQCISQTRRLLSEVTDQVQILTRQKDGVWLGSKEKKRAA